MEHSGFDDSAQRCIIASDGFESYYDILAPGESYIVNIAKGYSNRTVAAGKISFGLPCTNITISTIHWDQYFRRISGAPSLVGIRNEAKFRTVIEVARHRDRIRNQHLEESVRLSKSADLGKLKRHKNWIICSRALNNYL